MLNRRKLCKAKAYYYKAATVPVRTVFELLSVNCSRNMAKPYCGPCSTDGTILGTVRTIDPVSF